MRKESAWQGTKLEFKREKGHNPWSGRGLRYEWPKDKGLIYALMSIALDVWSSVRILPPELRETKFYDLNSAIVTDIINMGLAEEYLNYIEADLKAEGLLESKQQVQHKRKPGRLGLYEKDVAEAKRRNELLTKWDNEKGEMSVRQFCKRENVLYQNPRENYLKTCQDWARKKCTK